MATSARQLARAGAKTILDTYKAANPTRLVHTYNHPPGSYHTPCGYPEKEVTESISFSMGVRQRVLVVTLVVLNKQTDNKQATEEQDVLVDGLLDVATTLARTAVPGALIVPATVNDTERTDSNATYAGFELALQCEFQEGRTV